MSLYITIIEFMTELAIGGYTDWAARTDEPQSHEYCLAHDSQDWYGRECVRSYEFICEGESLS